MWGVRRTSGRRVADCLAAVLVPLTSIQDWSETLAVLKAHTEIEREPLTELAKQLIQQPGYIQLGKQGAIDLLASDQARGLHSQHFVVWLNRPDGGRRVRADPKRPLHTLKCRLAEAELVYQKIKTAFDDTSVTATAAIDRIKGMLAQVRSGSLHLDAVIRATQQAAELKDIVAELERSKGPAAQLVKAARQKAQEWDRSEEELVQLIYTAFDRFVELPRYASLHVLKALMQSGLSLSKIEALAAEAADFDERDKLVAKIVGTHDVPHLAASLRCRSKWWLESAQNMKKDVFLNIPHERVLEETTKLRHELCCQLKTQVDLLLQQAPTHVLLDVLEKSDVLDKPYVVNKPPFYLYCNLRHLAIEETLHWKGREYLKTHPKEYRMLSESASKWLDLSPTICESMKLAGQLQSIEFLNECERLEQRRRFTEHRLIIEELALHAEQSVETLPLSAFQEALQFHQPQIFKNFDKGKDYYAEMERRVFHEAIVMQFLKFTARHIRENVFEEDPEALQRYEAAGPSIDAGDLACWLKYLDLSHASEQEKERVRARMAHVSTAKQLYAIQYFLAPYQSYDPVVTGDGVDELEVSRPWLYRVLCRYVAKMGTEPLMRQTSYDVEATRAARKLRSEKRRGETFPAENTIEEDDGEN